MGNLKGYQVMTTVAKKVGGPRNLFLLTLAGGGVTYKLVETGVKVVVKKVKKAIGKEELIDISDEIIYKVHTEYSDGNGLTLSEGAEYRILASDGDSTLIEIITDDDNPYFVSAEVLKAVSNYGVSINE